MAPPEIDARNATSGWNATLERAVTDDGLVDYDVLLQRRESLDAYVAHLALPRSSAPSNARHAFWINAYNALTLYAVLENGLPATDASVMSVRNFAPVDGVGFFIEQAFIVDGYPISLWEIEHERLRMRTMDIRDHAALNCGSASCPPLRASMYEQNGLNRQLDEQMRRWINDPDRGVRVEDDEVVFSAIFEMYATDFHNFTAGDDLCTTARRYAQEPLKSALKALSDAGCPHRFVEFDWSLNRAR